MDGSEFSWGRGVLPNKSIIWMSIYLQNNLPSCNNFETFDLDKKCWNTRTPLLRYDRTSKTLSTKVAFDLALFSSLVTGNVDISTSLLCDVTFFFINSSSGIRNPSKTTKIPFGIFLVSTTLTSLALSLLLSSFVGRSVTVRPPIVWKVRSEVTLDRSKLVPNTTWSRSSFLTSSGWCRRFSVHFAAAFCGAKIV